MMKKLIAIMLMTIASFPMTSALDVDVNNVTTTTVATTGSVSGTVQLNSGQSLFFANNVKQDSCDGAAVLYTTESNAGSISFTVSDLNENSLDFKLWVNGNTIDLSSGSFDVNYFSSGQKVCLQGVQKGFGKGKIKLSDFVVTKTG